MDNPTLILAVSIALVVAALLLVFVWMAYRRRRLRQRFGPEYDHTLRAVGDRSEAERELTAREKRVAKLELHDLSDAERRDFLRRWREVQVGFVDRPSAAIADADRLVADAMRVRGYPVEDYRQRQADLSVEYPAEVQRYREALLIAGRNQRGEATTEELRQAMVCYRELFEHLVGPAPELETVETRKAVAS